MKTVLKLLASSFLIPLGLTACCCLLPSATDTVIHEKMFGSGVTTLIINE